MGYCFVGSHRIQLKFWGKTQAAGAWIQAPAVRSFGKVGVVEDVILAETVVSGTAGAVAELQVRILRIRPAADLTAVAVALFLGFLLLLLDGGFKVDGLFGVLAADCKAEFRQEVRNAVPEEHSVDEPQSHQRRQGHSHHGKPHPGQVVDGEDHVQSGQPLGLDGQNQIEADQCVGVQRSKGQKQYPVEIVAGNNGKRNEQAAWPEPP